jgi:hypothetical protein
MMRVARNCGSRNFDSLAVLVLVVGRCRKTVQPEIEAIVKLTDAGRTLPSAFCPASRACD